MPENDTKAKSLRDQEPFSAPSPRRAAGQKDSYVPAWATPVHHFESFSMKKCLAPLLLTFLLLTMLGGGCTKHENPLAPQSLSGDYTLLEFTDKRSNLTFISGIPTDDGSGLATTVTGSLFLTTERFTLTRTHVFDQMSGAPVAVTETVMGTYSIEESVFNIRDEATGRTDAIPIDVNGGQLILEDLEFRFVFERD